MSCLEIFGFKFFSINSFSSPLKEGAASGTYKINELSYSQVIFGPMEENLVSAFFQKIAILASNFFSYLISKETKWKKAQVGDSDKYTYVNWQEFKKKTPVYQDVLAQQAQAFSLPKEESSDISDPGNEVASSSKEKEPEEDPVGGLSPSDEASFDSLQKQRERAFAESQWANVWESQRPIYLSKKMLPPPLFISNSYFITAFHIFKNFKTDYSSPPPKGFTKRCKRSEDVLTGKRIARMVPIAKVGTDRKHQLERLGNESYFLERLKGCRGVVQMLACDRGRKNSWGQEKLAVYLTFYSKGELFGFLERGRTLGEAEKNKIAADLIEGMASMHGNDIVHNDMKPENILVGESWEAAICDFDLASEKSSSNLNKIGGSPIWCSPEKMYAAQHRCNFGFEDRKGADIWALGLILYLFFFKDMPPPLNEQVVPDRRTLDDWLCSRYIQSGSFFQEPLDVSSKEYIIWKMLQFRSSERFDIEEVRRRWSIA